MRDPLKSPPSPPTQAPLRLLRLQRARRGPTEGLYLRLMTLRLLERWQSLSSAPPQGACSRLPTGHPRWKGLKPAPHCHLRARLAVVLPCLHCGAHSRGLISVCEANRRREGGGHTWANPTQPRQTEEVSYLPG